MQLAARTMTAALARVSGSCKRPPYWTVWFALCLRDQFAHFKDRNHRQEAQEEKEQGRKESNGANKRGPVPDGGVIHPPRGRQEISMQAGDHNDKALHPHTSVDNQRD